MFLHLISEEPCGRVDGRAGGQRNDKRDVIASELRRASEHAVVAARHFRESDVPRGCAHAFALEGHLRRATDEIADLSKLHAERSLPGATDSERTD